MSKTIYSGHYEVQELIAEGGMGAVYKAWDNKLEIAVALKVIHSHLSSDTSFLERFRDEARKTARLRGHENIVQIFSVENDHGIEYLVMEYFPSNNLREELLHQPRLSIQDSVSIARQISYALAYTHSRDLIHRDIKPANILLDRNRKVKLTDFGIAKALDQAPLTSTGQLIGTVKYMSPEQARDDQLDSRADLYSLGMVFYEMVTGGNLWSGLSNTSILGKLQAESTIPPLTFPPDVPQEIQQVIKDLLRYRPADRIQSAESLASRLEELQPIIGTTQFEAKRHKESTAIISESPLESEPSDDEMTVALFPTSQPSSPPKSQNPSLETQREKPAPPQTVHPSAEKRKVEESDSLDRVERKEEIQEGQIQDFPEPSPPNTFIQKVVFASIIGISFVGSVYLFWPPSDEFKEKTSQENQIVTDDKSNDGLKETKNLAQRTEIGSQSPSNTEVQAQAEAAAKAKEAEAARLAEAKAAAEAQAQAEAAAKAKEAEAARLAEAKAQEEAAAKTALETQALTKLLDALQGSISKRDLLALKAMSTMSHNRERMLKELFARYATVEALVGNIQRNSDEATVTLEITKLIRPNGESVTPSPIVREITVVIPKTGNNWGSLNW